MVFNLFGRKKQETISDLLYQDMLFKQVSERLEKASSLQKLGRLDEARQVLLGTERAVEENVKKKPNSFHANLLLAHFYIKAAVPIRATVILERLMNSGEFCLDEQQRLILGGELQKTKRERPITEKRSEGGTAPQAYTQIYNCQNCGRLINYVSMACPHCQWSASTPSEMARSVILSNAYLDVPLLLILAREVSKGRLPREVVGNLETMAQEFMNIPKNCEYMDHLLQLLRKDEQKQIRNTAMVRKCPECGDRIIWNTSNLCEKCGA